MVRYYVDIVNDKEFFVETDSQGEELQRKPLREAVLEDPYSGEWLIGSYDFYPSVDEVYGNALYFAITRNDVEMVKEILDPMSDDMRLEYFNDEKFCTHKSYSKYTEAISSTRSWSFVDVLASYKAENELYWELDNVAMETAYQYYRAAERNLAEVTDGTERH